MKNIFLVFLAIIILIASGCENNSDRSSSSKSANAQFEETIDGTYTLSNNTMKLEITIIGNVWIGRTIIVSGFGSDYDNQNAEYDNGYVKGNDLYENSGMIKIGYVSGKSITTTIGRQYVTLRKN